MILLCEQLLDLAVGTLSDRRMILLCEQLLDLAVGTLERLRIVGPNGATEPSSTDHTKQRLEELIG